MLPNLIVAVETEGFRTVAGPLVASAFVMPASWKEPYFVYLDRWGLKRKARLLSKETPLEVIPGIVNYFQRTTLSCVFVRCSVEHIVERGARTAELEVAGMAVVRAMERLRVLHPEALNDVPLDSVRVYSSLQRVIPNCYLGQLKQGRPVSNWYTTAARFLAEAAHERAMREAAYKFPDYHFEQHRGFLTKEHRRLLRRLGPSPEHRGWHARASSSR